MHESGFVLKPVQVLLLMLVAFLVPLKALVLLIVMELLMVLVLVHKLVLVVRPVQAPPKGLREVAFYRAITSSTHPEDRSAPAPVPAPVPAPAPAPAGP